LEIILEKGGKRKMPARSESQRKLAGIALREKRGETPKSYSPEAVRMANSMSEEELRKMASKPGSSGHESRSPGLSKST
jgi:hypothetical protein